MFTAHEREVILHNAHFQDLRRCDQEMTENQWRISFMTLMTDITRGRIISHVRPFHE
jgi:hypothetical protein